MHKFLKSASFKFRTQVIAWDRCVPDLGSLLPPNPAMRKAAFDHSCVQFPCRYLFLDCDLISQILRLLNVLGRLHHCQTTVKSSALSQNISEHTSGKSHAK